MAAISFPEPTLPPMETMKSWLSSVSSYENLRDAARPLLMHLGWVLSVLRLPYIDRSFAFSLSNSSGVRIPRSFSFSNSSRRWMRFMGGAGATGAAGGGA